ncbi:hypothetical protein DFH09DRAFT_431415 [Mycena vulgaris]|nr:hypothetical protein DFH09DRAFT_431415 [Mycena vulgaris]
MLFSGFSLDVVLEIMSWCGPQDLQNLLLVNRLCRNLLVKNQYIWRLSRATIHLGFPLPALATSELSFIRAVFNGGPCTVCHRTTSELPYSFSLDIRICSAACSFYLLRVAPYDVDEFIASDPGAIFVDKPEDLNDSDSETLMLQSLPYLEWSVGLYRPSAVHSELIAFEEATDLAELETIWNQRASQIPAFMEMAETLQSAASNYRSKKSEVEHKNRGYLAALAGRNELSFEQLVASPTLARHVNAFARDLTLLSDTAWNTIRDVSLAEVRARISSAGNPVACPFCDRGRLPERLLRDHIRDVHPEHYVGIATKMHHCTLCLDSSRRFNLKTLKRHVFDSHLAVRRDLF